MYYHIIENDLLSISEFFLPGHSTVHHLIELTHNIRISLENYETNCQVFCDISKAFDRVWHRELPYKLDTYGVKGDLFVNCCQFMYLVVSLLVLRAGCGIWLHQFLIIAYPFTLLWVNSYLNSRKQKVLLVWAGAFLSVAWPTGVQLLVFFCSSVPVVLFGTPGSSGCRSQHVPVESSSLLHHSTYLWFICFPWWSIDELENLHADRTTVYFEPW